MMNQFNRLMATPAGVTEIYDQSGSTHLIVVHIKGVRSSDRSRIDGDFSIIEAKGKDFIVQSSDGKIYQVGLDSTAQIILEEITADVDRPAITNIEPLTVDNEPLPSALEKFNRAGAMVFLSGELTLDDDLEGIRYTPDPYQFPFIKVSGTSLTLEDAPLSTVVNYFSDQDAEGQLLVRIIHCQNS